VYIVESFEISLTLPSLRMLWILVEESKSEQKSKGKAEKSMPKRKREANMANTARARGYLTIAK